SLESQVATSEREKQLAIRETELNQKSFTDSVGFEKIMEAVPSALGMFAQMKQGQVPSGLGTADNVSEAKKGLVSFISSDKVNDKDADFFATVIFQMSNNPEFNQGITNFVNEFNN